MSFFHVVSCLVLAGTALTLADGAIAPPAQPVVRQSSAGPNQPCVIGSTQCPSGYTCSCGGYCRKQASFDISLVADDGVILWICGTNVRQTSNFDELQSFTYNGVCDDFIFEVTNDVFSAGVAMLVTSGGQRYGTTSPTFPFPGTIPLLGRATFSPQGNWRNNSPNYNYFSWTPAVVVETILGQGQNFNTLASQGAYPICSASGNLPAGTIGVRVQNPLC